MIMITSTNSLNAVNRYHMCVRKHGQVFFLEISHRLYKNLLKELNNILMYMTGYRFIIKVFSVILILRQTL